MLTLLAHSLLLCVAPLVLWKIFCRLLARSALNNIPGPPAQSFLKGAIPQLFNPNAWDFHKEMERKYGSIIRIKAVFGENMLFVYDPKAMHHLIVKDQYIYEETDSFIKTNRLMFGHGLLGTLGDQHRKQRKMLNPVFSISHMREMVPIFFRVSAKLCEAFANRVKDEPREIEVLSWMSRAALELVGQSGLGYSFDNLTSDEIQHRYSASVKQLVPVSSKMVMSRIYLLGIAMKIGTPRFRRFMINLIPWKNLRAMRDISDTLCTTSVEIFESKKKALAEGNEALAQQIGEGKDILSILMRANMIAKEEESLTEEELIGQMSTLIFAATDTTSSALSRILWLLSQNQSVQDRLRLEIRQARKEHSDLAYDTLVALPYLDAVCRETLRLYAPIPMISRVARQDIILPLSKPITGVDGREIHEVPIPKNTEIIIGLMASNRDPDIWGPDSYEWKPERWLKPLPETVAAAHIPGIYSNLMTFIGGGRSCIGFKFSQLEMKVVLTLLLDQFKFSPSLHKETLWEMNSIVTPAIAGSKSSSPQLPLLVEIAK